MSQTITVSGASQRSEPFAIDRGSKITYTPTTSGYLEYSSGSLADAKNAVAVWAKWPPGTVSAVSSDTPMISLIGRIVGQGSAVVEDSDPQKLLLAFGNKYYSGSPVGNLTPDFIGQRCQDTTTNIFYVAVSMATSGWALASNGVTDLIDGAIPFVRPSSGSMAANGAVTATTAMNRTIGASYSYFPSGAVFSGSAAGWYYTVWSSTTVGTVYNNVYSSGQPTIPASLTAVSAAGPGAYTQSTSSDLTGPNVTVPAGAMGVNGSVWWERADNNNNSAGTKTYNTFFGASSANGNSQTTNPYHGACGSIKNAGAASKQTCVNGAHGDPGNAGGFNYLTIDTSAAVIVSFAMNCNTATDYSIIESYLIQLRPKL